MRIETLYDAKQVKLNRTFTVNKTKRLRVGHNDLSNRLSFINGRVNPDWLNSSFPSFKIKCKCLFL